MPVIFVGHGSPMHAIQDGPWPRAWAALGQALPRPRAIVCVSAHWYVRGSFVCALEQPPTIHDFGGFPAGLYEVQYPAPGSPQLANRVAALTGAEAVQDWGLDHGAWSVLRHMYPNADVPVVQLSIDSRLKPKQHLEVGQKLAPLAGEGVLVVGSGNITHNLRDAFRAMQTGETATPNWASDFDQEVATALEARDHEKLAELVQTPNGHQNHPTPDHYAPLLYAAAASQSKPTYPAEGFDLSSLSMRCVRWD